MRDVFNPTQVTRHDGRASSRLASACAALLAVASAHADTPPALHGPDWGTAPVAGAAPAAPPAAPTSGPPAPTWTPPAGSQRAPSSLQRTGAAPASTPTPSAVAPSTAPRAPIQATLPRNLFQMPDAAMVAVGTHQVRAGDLKRVLRTALHAKASSPVTTVVGHRLFANASGPSVHALAMSGPGPLTLTGQTSTRSATSPSANTGAVAPHAVSANLAGATQAGVTSELCAHSPPKIARVGTVTPGGVFEVSGQCFGTSTGQLTIVGNVPGGTMQIPLLSWSVSLIRAQMPPVSGVGDGTVAVAVTTAAGVTGGATSTGFVAAREHVDVSAKWIASSHYDHDEVASADQVAATIGQGQPITNVANFQISINPTCALDNMAITMRAGYLVSETGFDQGPLNSASATVTVNEACISTYEVTTSTYGLITDTAPVSWNSAPCHAEYDIQSFAYCPVGVAP